MPIIEDIRCLDRAGVSGREISRQLRVSRDSVTKYTQITDYSPKVPVTEVVKPGRVIGPVVGIINTILEADKNAPRKQRHTAKRIFDRLVAEEGFTGSYRVVARYVSRWKKARQTQHDSFAELVWPPGSAQVDFGSVQVASTDGTNRVVSMLVLSLPFSNTRYAQIYPGENAECVCHGLRTIFEHIGFIPPVIVFDNATGIGRRVGTRITESKLFSQFRAHYRFKSKFCNPYSGNEKGSVENAVGYLRRNLMVPVPIIDDIDAYNTELLAYCDGLLEQSHYRKNQPLTDLVATDRNEGLPLPGSGFNPTRFEVRRADRLGRVKIENNYYLADPAAYGIDVTVGIGYNHIDFYKPTGEYIRTLPRCYEHSVTTITNPAPLLSVLATRAGAWRETPLRPYMPAEVVMWLDRADFDDRRRALKHLDRVCAAGCGFDATMNAAEALLHSRQPIEEGTLTLLARRAGINHHPNSNVDLRIYDTMMHSGITNSANPVPVTNPSHHSDHLLVGVAG